MSTIEIILAIIATGAFTTVLNQIFNYKKSKSDNKKAKAEAEGAEVDLDEKLIKREYWTYKDRAEEQRDKNFRNGQYNKPIEYDKKSTPKSRFIHDLMVDFAIYLRKWAELVEYEFTEKYYTYTGIV